MFATGSGGMPKAWHVLWHALQGLACSVGGISPWHGGAGLPAAIFYGGAWPDLAEIGRLDLD